MTYTSDYLDETIAIVNLLSRDDIDLLAAELLLLRKRQGRLFMLGNGGSAANASHAVNDFRKITGIETYAPTDNVAEMTARTNDDGWASTFANWLKGCNLNRDDAIFVLSVGGGSGATSPNIVMALGYARTHQVPILSIVGRDGGFAAAVSTACLLVPSVCDERITPHVEEIQSIVLHLLATHPRLGDA